MQSQRASDPGPVTAYKLQLPATSRHQSMRLHPWDLPDVVGGFPGSAPPKHAVQRSSGAQEARGPSSGAQEARGPSSGAHRRSTAAFADRDYFRKQSVDIGRYHEDLHSPFDHDPAARRSKASDSAAAAAAAAAAERTSGEFLGFTSTPPLTTTIYIPETDELPDWYVELDTTQMVIFHKILRLLDSRELSILDRTELFDLLKEVVVDVTLSQVDEVIDDLQGHSEKGQLDFDEFLYSLAEMQRTEGEADKQEERRQEEEGQTTDKKKRKVKRDRYYSLAQKIYYSAIASFSVLGATQSPLELQRKHKAREERGPHLLGHFLFSQTRSSGKSKKLLRTMMREMLRNARGQFSPYIHPLPFVRIGKRRRREPPHQCPRRKPVHTEETEADSDGEFRPSVVASMKIQQLSPVAVAAFRKMSLAAENRTELDEFMAEDEEIFLDEDDINYVLKVYAEHGSVVAQLPDINLVPGIRQTLARISIYDPLCSSERRRRQTMKLLRKQLKNLEMEDPKVRLMRQRKDRIKFFMPHVRRLTVPIPHFRPTTCELLNVTPTNIANMHHRIQTKLVEYRYQLKMAHVKHAWKLLERLPLSNLPAGSRERFLQVFRAYQPLRLRDIYVISPYVPNVSYLD